MNTGGKERKNVIDTLSKRKRTDFELGSRFQTEDRGGRKSPYNETTNSDEKEREIKEDLEIFYSQFVPKTPESTRPEKDGREGVKWRIKYRIDT